MPRTRRSRSKNCTTSGTAASVSWSFPGRRSSIAPTTRSTSWPTTTRGSSSFTPASYCAQCLTGRGRNVGPHAARAPRGDRAAVSEADGAWRALRQPGIRVGRRGFALEPERLLRSQRLDAAEDAGTAEPLPGHLLVEWRGAGHRHAQQRPERVHQAGVWLRHESREDRDRRRHVPFALRRLRRAGLHTPYDSGRDDGADPPIGRLTRLARVTP